MLNQTLEAAKNGMLEEKFLDMIKKYKNGELDEKYLHAIVYGGIQNQDELTIEKTKTYTKYIKDKMFFERNEKMAKK